MFVNVHLLVHGFGSKYNMKRQLASKLSPTCSFRKLSVSLFLCLASGQLSTAGLNFAFGHVLHFEELNVFMPTPNCLLARVRHI